MKILVVGTWRKSIAEKYKDVAEKLGETLAREGFDLVSGGGEGTSELVVNSYKKNKGKKYIAYLPSKSEMEKVGEKIGPKPDKILQTGLDYPERNIKMVRECDVVIALNGGSGTLTEIVHAVKDYGKRVSVLDYGELADWCRMIPDIKSGVFITKDIKKAIENIIQNDRKK